MAKLPTIEEFAKKVSDLALDEFEYEGKTIREWTELILNGNLTEAVRCKDCKHHHDCEIHFCDALGMDCPDDSEFFCSCGERKEGTD